MHTRRLQHILAASAWGPGVAVCVLLGCTPACHKDAPPPALHTSAEPGADEAVQPKQEAPPDRDLWFADGPGRAAIIAREQQDHEAAVAALDALLQKSDLSAEDRAAAQWLRGLEDLHAERYAEAAERFAEARSAGVFDIVQIRLRLLEAQARLGAGQPEQALKLVEAVDDAARKATPLAEDLLVVEGDAHARTKDDAGAREVYERYLSQYPRGGHRLGVTMKLARLLAASESADDKRRAAELFEKVLLESPLSDYGEDAEKAVAEIDASIGPRRKGAKARAFARELELSRLDALLDRRRYGDAMRAADGLLSSKVDDAERCHVLYVKASAIFKQRERAKSRPVFDKAVKACEKAGADARTKLVKSWYQAGRGLYAEGKYKKAAQKFEKLAKEHDDHSYADDAWVLAGESWSEHGDADKATDAFRSALKVTGGDMADEARRRLLVQAFADKDHDGVLALVDEGLAAHPGRVDKGKLLYFRGRALAAKGDEAAAVEAWVEVLREAPLDYPGLQALSRLRETSDDALQAGLAVMGDPGEDAVASVPDLPSTPGAKRAVLLARLGLGDAASQELDFADVSGWPAIAVLNQAGLWSEAQKMLARMASGWRAEAPSSSSRERWEHAYPRPFREIIVPGEKSHGVPSLLTFAVMQTESRFNPGVTSWAGARGLVQLMPATARGVASSVGIEIESDEQLFDPVLNLDLGQRYLGRLVGKFGGDEGAAALAVPSYNGGAGNVREWFDERGTWPLDLFIESIPFDETRRYTQTVLGRWHAYRWLYGDGDPKTRIPFLPQSTPTPT